jgi:hypothetical protein
MMLPDFGKVFFLGLVDTATPFTSATLTSNGVNADFLFNIDDIRGQFDAAGPIDPQDPIDPNTPVPEPGSLMLVATGLAAGVRRWRASRNAA